jgi:hypothetical protein
MAARWKRELCLSEAQLCAANNCGTGSVKGRNLEDSSDRQLVAVVGNRTANTLIRNLSDQAAWLKKLQEIPEPHARHAGCEPQLL